MSNQYSNLIPGSNAYGLLRLPQVMQLVGLGRSSIFAKVKTGDFPRPIKIGARIIAWPREDIDQWIAQITGGICDQ